jgi:hypothetical protein
MKGLVRIASTVAAALVSIVLVSCGDEATEAQALPQGALQIKGAGGDLPRASLQRVDGLLQRKASRSGFQL